MVRDGFGGTDIDPAHPETTQPTQAGGEDDGWLRTGGMAASQEARMKDVRTLGESGEVGDREEEEEEIPDMEDEEDDEEAIINEKRGDGSAT